jgi:hypothetical protein
MMQSSSLPGGYAETTTISVSASKEGVLWKNERVI